MLLKVLPSRSFWNDLRRSGPLGISLSCQKGMSLANDGSTEVSEEVCRLRWKEEKCKSQNGCLSMITTDLLGQQAAGLLPGTTLSETNDSVARSAVV
jgi:hypothetical protein